MLDLIRTSITTVFMLLSPAVDHADGVAEAPSPTAMNTTFTADPSPDIYTSESNGEITVIGGPDFTDIFPSSTSVSTVVVTIYPPTTSAIEVASISGPTWVEGTGGAWQATFSMPSPGGENKAEIEVKGSGGNPGGVVIIIGREGP